MGVSGDTDLLTLASGKLTVAGETETTTLDVNGVADVSGTVTLSGNAQAVTHSGNTGLTIQSTGGSASYVAVESVVFSTTKVGVSGDTDLLTLASGALTVAGTVTAAVADTSANAVTNVLTLTHSLSSGTAAAGVW